MTYYKREIVKLLKETLADFPVVVMAGLRQTGKSTLLLSEPFLKGRTYINLDEFTYLVEARERPEDILAGPRQITIDEVQRVPDLLIEIKNSVDRKRRPGRFLLSGSANLLLMEKVSESLAGRAIYLYLRPMNRRECSRSLDTDPFLIGLIKNGTPERLTWEGAPVKDKDILDGGLPPVCTGLYKRKENWFSGYEETYVEKDVRNLANIADLIPFRRTLHIVANRTAQLLNISQLAVDAGISVPTANRYIDLLETSFLINRIPPYLTNRTSRLIKTQKIFVSDSGMAASLAGISSLSKDPFKGHLVETYVAQNLQSILESHMIRSRLYFWQVQGRHEVDFVIEVGREVIAIEVKSATRWNLKDLSGLKAFLHAEPRCKAGILAYNGKNVISLGEKLWAVPLALLLS